jgi:hypothetical protein
MQRYIVTDLLKYVISDYIKHDISKVIISKNCIINSTRITYLHCPGTDLIGSVKGFKFIDGKIRSSEIYQSYNKGLNYVMITTNYYNTQGQLHGICIDYAPKKKQIMEKRLYICDVLKKLTSFAIPDNQYYYKNIVYYDNTGIILTKKYYLLADDTIYIQISFYNNGTFINGTMEPQINKLKDTKNFFKK